MSILMINTVFVCILAFLSDLFSEPGRIIKRNRSLSVFFACILTIFLIIISGFRYKSGTDYWGYSDIYYLIGINGIVDLREIGFSIIIYLLNKVTDNPQILFFIVAFLTNIFIVKVLYKNSISFSFSVFLYLGLFTYYSTFNGIRQYLAASIIFLSFRNIVDKNFKSFLLSVLVASLFHETALIFCIFYFFSRNDIKSLGNIVIIMLFVLMIIFYYPFINTINLFLTNNRYEMYSDWLNTEGQGVNILRILVWLLPILISYMYRKELVARYGDYIKVVFNLSFYGFLFMLLAIKHFIFARVSIYFELYYLLLIPCMCKCIPIKAYRLICYIVIICYFMYSTVLLLSGESRVLPYSMNFNLF